MIDRRVLTIELARQVTALEDDLRRRADTVAEVAAVVEAEWQGAHDAGRSAHDLVTWRESLLTQVAVGWVLATVFLRFCEDTGLLADPVLGGPGERNRRAEDAQRAWFRQHPAEGERGYVGHVFAAAAELPGLAHVFEAHNPLWQFGPSDDAVRALLTYWREVVPETGALRRDFTDSQRSTRFLGDLYQDLSASARKQYALLQTPEFVEEFILDRTLEPALDEFGLENFRMIDPACGSGHFLLGSFDRLLARWRARAPQEGDRALAERALRSVHGVDLNPFAAAIARFRLLVAALQAAGITTLAEAPLFTINIAVGDSLLHGPPPGQQMAFAAEITDPASRHLFATEDAGTIHQMLSGGYHAVVANPPYITPKDPAANAAYRRRYPQVCHRQYALSVPFLQRLFDLAVPAEDGRPAGFVGQITANSFMKREFGKPLIERYLARQVDLTHVIDTSGAYIPGHGTPTVILLGRQRRPVGDTVRAVLGIRGEPSRPAEPAKGEVWTAICDLVDRPGAENEFVSVADVGRDRLASHPWSLQGGGADGLKAVVEGAARIRLDARAAEVGFGAMTREDDVFRIGRKPCQRAGVAADLVRPLVAGEDLRDWWFASIAEAIWPYDEESLSHLPAKAVMRFLWPWKRQLSERVAYGSTQLERGRAWDEYSMFFEKRYRTPLSIAFAFMATHNHFVLDRGGKVFSQGAPVIKLPAGATEDEHLALVGLLNSAVACFWMKQVCFNKGSTVDTAGARQTTTPFEDFYQFDGTKLKQFPIPAGSALAWAQRLDASARELADNLPGAIAARQVPTRQALDAARATVEELRADMVATQEELDWRCLHLYGVTAEDLSLSPGGAPPIERGQRAFEIALARQEAAGEVRTSWFTRHGSTPVTEPPVVEAAARKRLGAASKLIGYYGQTNADEVMLAARHSFRRRGVEAEVVTLMAVGDQFRDWSFSAGDSTLFPYDATGLMAIDRMGGAHRWLWPCRTVLGERRTFAKTSYFEDGRAWWEWHQIALDRLRTPLSIAFAEVATHNHFVLDRGGKVFKQTAPVIKLPAEAGEDEHLALVGLLNSSVACFWMKQVSHNKGNRGTGGGITDEGWEQFFQFDGTKLKQFPIPAGSALAWAQRLDAAARELADNLPGAIAVRQVPTRQALDAARATVAELRADMVTTQEELDWRCLHLYGVTAEDLSLLPGGAPPIERGQRAFEIALARQMAAGEVRTSWFTRHGSTPVTEPPAHWPLDYRQLVERRIELIGSDRFVGLVERAECKRRWNWEAWADLERAALRTWLLDRLEEPRYWPATAPRSAAQLADDAARDDDFTAVAALYAGTVDVDLTALVTTLVKQESVPYLAAWRYSGSGLRTRAAWERTWDLQRRQDAGEDVGTIPVPPRYGQGDFADTASWKLRGKLDVPKERFVAYPGLGREADPTPLVGWAGWDHLRCAQALATTYEQRRAVDGWRGMSLVPILAGLAELVPWLRQWHNDLDRDSGLALGDFFADFVATEAAANGVGPADLAAWSPPRKAGRRARP